MKTNRELEKQLKNKFIQEMGSPNLRENGLDLLKEEIKKIVSPKKRGFKIRFASAMATLLIALIAVPAVHLILTGDLKNGLSDNGAESPSSDSEYSEEKDPITSAPETNPKNDDPKEGDPATDDSLNETPSVGTDSEVREGTGDDFPQVNSFWYYYAGGAALLLIGLGATYTVVKHKKE